MMNQIRSLSLLAFAATVMVFALSCKGDDRNEEVPSSETLSILPYYSTIDFSSDGTTAIANGKSINPTFTVTTSEASWNVALNPSSLWLSWSKENDNTFSLTAEANEGATPSPTVTVTVTGIKAQPITFTVTQGGYDQIPSYDESLFMHIGAFDMVFDVKKIQEVAVAGFTLLIPGESQVNFGINASSALQFMDYAQAFGLKVSVHDRDFCEYIFDSALGGITTYKPANNKNVHLYKDHPAFYGMNLCDEPQADQFNLVKQKLNEFRAEFPNDKLGCVNINPYRTGFYSAWVDNYMNTVQPSFLSYDDYAMFADGSVRNSYLQVMSFIKNKAMQYGVPAHQYILTVGHVGESAYRSPSLEDLRWQIACLMTYGYEWFTHYNISGYGANPETMWNNNGTTNALYEKVKTVNLEVHDWDHVYMSFLEGWEGVTPINGSSGSTDNFFSLLLISGYFKTGNIGGINSIASVENILVGEFKDKDNRKGFMITNATNPYNKKSTTVTIKFENSYSRLLVYEFGKPKVYDLDEQQGITLAFEPGEGKFVIPF